MALKDSLGKWGERYATYILASQGFEILDLNLRTPAGEVDVLAKDDDCLVICEVKTRRGSRAGVAGEAIDTGRVERLRRIAEHMLCEFGAMRSARVDAVLIDITESAIAHLHVKGLS